MAIHHCITKHYFNDVDLMGEDGITGIYIGIPHHRYHKIIDLRGIYYYSYTLTLSRWWFFSHL
jgi:hypothetical protein